MFKSHIHLLLPLLLSAPAMAHEPLFMMSHEAPGRGAFDVHAGLSGTRGADIEETALEGEFTVGITRDIALKAHLPALRIAQVEPDVGIESELGFEDPSLTAKWRFWNDNDLGRKFAAAAMLQSTIPLDGGLPVVHTGLTQGMESLTWYYFVDARARLAPTALEDGPGTQLYADVAGGWRPYLHALNETDIVLFLEVNYERRLPDQLGGSDIEGTGGDFVFLSPELLASPNNRVMFKTGFQLPLLQFPQGTQPRESTRFVLETELRF